MIELIKYVGSKKNKLWGWGTPVMIIILLQLLLLPFCFGELGDNLFPVDLMSKVPLKMWMFTPWGWVGAFIFAVTVYLYCRGKSVPSVSIKSQCVVYSILLLFYLLANPYLSLNWMHLPMAILFASSLIFLSIALLRWGSIIIWSIIFFMGFISYGVTLNNVVLNDAVMCQILSTSLEDALRYMTFVNISFLILGVIVAIGISCFLYRALKSINRVSLLKYSSVALIAPIVFMYFLRTYLPFGTELMWPVLNTQELVEISKNAYKQMKRTEAILSRLPDESTPINTSISTVEKDSGVVCILHIGESVNASHCSFNGYHRNTTPWLASQKSLINFRDCVSSSDMTDWAVLTMLTNGRRSMVQCNDDKMLPSSPSIMDFFALNGFKCYGFWANCYVDNSINNTFTQMVRYFGRKAVKQYGYSGDVFNQLKDISSVLKENEGRNVFVMINNDGSHCYYHGYDKVNPPYPVAYTPQPNFTPQSKKEHAEIFLNAYDSTIHYTDRYICSLIESLKGKPFLYVYMSDHGDYLGEAGCWTRGSTPLSKYYVYHACKIPFFILASPEFENLHPHFKKSVEQLRKSQGLRTAHEHLFHTMLGIMGISTEYYDESLDLSNCAVKSYSGPAPVDYPKH